MTASLHFDRPWVIAGVAFGWLTVSGAIAKLEPVPQWELDLTTWLNGAPDLVAHALFPVMQLGTLVAPLGLAALILIWKRDLSTASAAAVAGLVTWFAAKGVKRLVQRGRPLEFLPSIHIRDGSGTGFGFVSGHSAVAACTALVAMTVVPRSARPWLVLLAALVGVARIVHGVHLPADVVGGWAFGVLIGLGTVELFGQVRDRANRQAATPV